MPRPTKNGLDYFSYDCNSDRSIKMLVRKFGLVSEAIYINLLKWVYSEGYYLIFTEELMEDFIIEFNLDESLFNDVFTFMLDRDLFDKDLYNDGFILTSTGIQKRYLLATSRRKESTIKDFKLINVDNNKVNVSNNRSEHELMQHDVNKSTQSKVKEIKEKKKTKAKKEFIPPTIEEVKKYFDENGYTESHAVHVFNYYSDGDWKDAQGNQVIRWKQKMRGNWFKDQGKKQYGANSQGVNHNGQIFNFN